MQQKIMVVIFLVSSNANVSIFESDVIAAITKCPFPKSVTTIGSLMYADVCNHNMSHTFYKIKYFLPHLLKTIIINCIKQCLNVLREEIKKSILDL